MPEPIDLLVLPHVVARTPRHLGLNIERTPLSADTNLRDWLLDSGATLVREMHPPYTPRQPQPVGRWNSCVDRASFDAFRARLAADPAKAVDWAAFTFDRPHDWRGVPDELIGGDAAIGLAPLVSLEYSYKNYPRPFLAVAEGPAEVADNDINWDSAASAYEFFFASVWHHGSVHGVTRYLMPNEPEFVLGAFALPEDLRAELAVDPFKKLFRESSDEALRVRYFAVAARHVYVIARVARLALDDAARALGRSDFVLGGPVSGKWETFWQAAADACHVFDYHHYSWEPEAVRTRHRHAASLLRPGQALGVSEFNGQAGEMHLEESLLLPGNSLRFADILLALLGASPAEGAVCEWAVPYLLSFPSTHRNYKSLVYGDMNFVDWSDRDAAMWSRGPEWHPTRAELELRAPTLAFHLFRMLARLAGQGAEPGEVLENILTTWDSARAPKLFEHLRTLVVRRGGNVYINILNLSPRAFGPVRVRLDGMATRPAWAVVRETSVGIFDLVRAQQPVTVDAPVEISLPPRSLIQVVLTPLALDRVSALRLVEHTVTPGSLAALEVNQTTRLRALGTIDGVEHDLTQINVIWTSERPRLFPVYQGGLVQRARQGGPSTRIDAKTFDGRAGASVQVG